MKFLIVFACALAVASAGQLVAPIAPFYPGASPAAYPTTLGVPAVTASGVPLDTPEVNAAKLNHFTAHAEAASRTAYPTAYTYPFSTLYRARRGVVTPLAYTTPFVSTSAYTYPYTHSPVLYRARRGIVAPVAYSTYTHTPVVATSAFTYPYAHTAAVHYRKRRAVVAPVAYTGYAHTPVVTTSAYSYPYTHNTAFLYRKRRGVVAPVVASYSHTPFVASTYSAFPYAHYY